MNDTLHRTDTLNPFKNVTCGKQKDYWVEFQLLDELGEPVANMPYRAINEATRTGYVAEYAGQSDAQGVIRLDGLHPLAITLKIEAAPLLEQMQTRRLRAVRPEPPRPGPGDHTPLYGPAFGLFADRGKGACGRSWLPLLAYWSVMRSKAYV
jgi:hypothetical protein